MFGVIETGFKQVGRCDGLPWGVQAAWKIREKVGGI